jgi:hypothetical protein
MADQQYSGECLIGLMRTFDDLIHRKYRPKPENERDGRIYTDPLLVATVPLAPLIFVDTEARDEDLKKLMVEERERRERLQQQEQADDIRLRRYNDEWIKNNIH